MTGREALADRLAARYPQASRDMLWEAAGMALRKMADIRRRAGRLPNRTDYGEAYLMQLACDAARELADAWVLNELSRMMVQEAGGTADGALL